MARDEATQITQRAGSSSTGDAFGQRAAAGTAKGERPDVGERFGPGRDAQRAVDVLQVGVDGADAEFECPGHGAVGTPGRDINYY